MSGQIGKQIDFVQKSRTVIVFARRRALQLFPIALLDLDCRPQPLVDGDRDINDP